MSKLVIITHKEIYSGKNENSFATTGGFPFQIKMISKLFSSTSLLCTLRDNPFIDNLTEIKGKNLSVVALKEPPFNNYKRHFSLLIWLPKNIKTILKHIESADIVHSMIPGDIGLIGLLIALFLKKKIFVRHCGTWGNKTTLADRFIFWLLPIVASKKVIVFATGGGQSVPEPNNQYIHWIFSTSIQKKEWENITPAEPWTPELSLKLIAVSRITKDKNIKSIIFAFSLLKKHFSDISLEIIGDGEEKKKLEKIVIELNLKGKITFTGNLDHNSVINKMSESHIFLFPTRTKEGFPKVLIEAMACGLPIISSRVSVIPEMIENKCGIILDTTDANSICGGIIGLIDNPKKLGKMGKEARRISKGFFLEKWQDSIKTTLEKHWIDQ